MFVLSFSVCLSFFVLFLVIFLMIYFIIFIIFGNKQANRRMTQRLENARRQQQQQQHQNNAAILSSTTKKNELIASDLEGEDAAARRENPMAAMEALSDVGDFKQRMRELGARIAVRRREGRSTDGLVGHWLFTGSPGTGKTTVARHMSSVLHAFGVLATPLVRSFRLVFDFDFQ